MEQKEEPTTWLNQDTYDRLFTELTHLSTAGRTEIAKRIETAREEGDLKENGGYHAAKDEQGKREARIRQLTALLRSAQVGAAPVFSGVVEPGTVITALIGSNEDTFLLGNREIASESKLNVYSENSPIGSALIGLKIGEETSFSTPAGKSVTMKILNIETWIGQ